MSVNPRKIKENAVFVAQCLSHVSTRTSSKRSLALCCRRRVAPAAVQPQFRSGPERSRSLRESTRESYPRIQGARDSTQLYCSLIRSQSCQFLHTDFLYCIRALESVTCIQLQQHRPPRLHPLHAHLHQSSSLIGGVFCDLLRLKESTQPFRSLQLLPDQLL